MYKMHTELVKKPRPGGLRLLAMSLLASIFYLFSLHSHAATNYRFEHLITGDGVSVGATNTIFQDSQGFMWLGGSNGVARYNGHSYTIFQHDTQDPQSIAHSYIWAIAEDNDGYLWFGTTNGLSRFDRASNKFKNFYYNSEQPNSMASNVIRRILVDSRGNLWVATEGGLDLYDPQNEHFIHHPHDSNNPNSISHDYVMVMFEDSKGRLWVGTNQGGVNIYDYKTKTFKRFTHSSPLMLALDKSRISDLAEDKEGNLWIATYDGLFKFNEKQNKLTRYMPDENDPNSLSSTQLERLLVDNENQLWATTNSAGLNVFNRDTNDFTVYKNNRYDPTTINSNNLKQVFQDRAGDFWIGLFPAGLDFVNSASSEFSVFRNVPDNKNSLSNNTINIIHEAMDGKVWIGTEGGVNLFDPRRNSFKHFTHDENDPNSIGANAILSMTKDNNGNHWFGTWSGGLNRYSEKTGKFERFMPNPNDPKSISSAFIWSLLSDSKGYLWVGTERDSLDRYDPKTGEFKRFVQDVNNPDALAGIYMRQIYEDRDGVIWVGTLEGLHRFNANSETFTRYEHVKGDASSLANNAVAAIYEDSRGVLWVGTDAGLSRMDRKTNKFKNYYQGDNGLVSDAVAAISEDRNGDLWLNTQNGLSRFNVHTETFQNYTKFNGLAGHVMPRNASYYSKDGYLYVGSTQGMTRFRPERLTANKYIPPVYFTEFAIFKEPVPIGGELLSKDVRLTETITLDYKQSMFSFEFAALNFRNPETNQYSYRMEGFDDKWIEAGHQFSATYTNLNAGEYVFTVKGSNNDGVWNNEGRSIKIIQLPPPWKTWWAYTLYALAVLGIIAWFVYSQRRKRQIVEEQNRILEIKVAERTAELRKKNQDIQAMLSNMHQGLFTVEKGGQIHPEYSSYLESIFETNEVAGRDVLDLLFSNADLGSDAYNQVQVVIDSIIGEDELNFDCNAHLLIGEYDAKIGPAPKHLSLDWNPIVVEDEISKLMVTVRDVTELRKMESEAESQKRELDIVGQLIQIPGKKYLAFEKSSMEFIAENREKIQACGSASPDDDLIALLFRNMHTIKGNCRTFAFHYLSDTVHEVESTYTELKESEERNWNPEELLKDLDLVESGLQEYANVYRSVLGRGEGNADEASLGDNKVVQSIRNYISSIQKELPDQKDRKQLTPIEDILDEAFTSPIDEVLEDIIKSLPSIADQLGKVNPDVNIDADNVRIKEEANDLLNNVFAHILRNCVDHGIEPPDDRAAAGKPDKGTIELYTTVDDEKLDIHVKDDGRGVNITRLFAKGVETGQWQESDSPSPSEVAQLIFMSGVSTKEQVSDISGRGVGMDAVKQFLINNGGDVNLNLLADKKEGEDFVPFETIVTLPAKLYSQTGK